MSDEISSESSSSSTEEVPAQNPNLDVPAPPKSSPNLIRGVVCALVASINCHCNGQGKDEADTITQRVETDLADADALTPEEIEHLDQIFNQIKGLPSLKNPFPAPPIIEEPSESSESSSSAEPIVRSGPESTEPLPSSEPEHPQRHD